MGEVGDRAFLADDAGDVIAAVLRDPLLTRGRAAAPTNVVGVPLNLLFPCKAEQPLHSLGFQHVVNGRQERRFLGDLTCAPPSGGREGRKLFLRMGETRFQPLHLALGMHRRAKHQHPFAPPRLTVLQATRPFNFITLGCQHLFLTVIEAENPLQRAVPAFLSPGADPVRHHFSRRARSWQRRQVHMMATRHVRAGTPCTHLTIADTQQAALVQPRLDALDERHIEAIISALTREHIRGSRHPKRVQ